MMMTIREFEVSEGWGSLRIQEFIQGEKEDWMLFYFYLTTVVGGIRLSG